MYVLLGYSLTFRNFGAYLSDNEALAVVKFCICVANLLYMHSIALFCIAASAGTNKAASSSTSLNTRKLDEDTENLARE
mgnify:CR=1 FL=1